MSPDGNETKVLRQEKFPFPGAFSEWEPIGLSQCFTIFLRKFDTRGRIPRQHGAYAKAAFTSFVSRVHFRTHAVVLRHIWHLADVGHSFPFTAASIHNSYDAYDEDWRKPEQCFYGNFRAGHGSELYSFDDSRRGDGFEVWSESPVRGLLSRDWRCVTIGVCSFCDFEIDLGNCGLHEQIPISFHICNLLWSGGFGAQLASIQVLSTHITGDSSDSPERLRQYQHHPA